MTRPSSWASRLTIAAIFCFLVLVGYALLWTTFMVYDDEGYVLHSLRTFAAHGHLYDQVYTQYGPFFFVFFRALHALGLVFTNTTARALALGCWLGAVAACGGVVWRATRGNLLATAGTLLATFLHLLAMSSEPSHPGGLIALLTAVTAWGGANPRWAGWARAGLVALMGSMLVLTKINVGVFLFVGTGAWWLLQIPGVARRPWARRAIAVMIAAVPVALMLGSIHESWVRVFMLVVAAGAAATVLVTEPAPEFAARPSDALAAVGATIVVIAGTFLLTSSSGTSGRELLEGVILGPLRHPSLYWVPLTWRTGSVAVAAIAVPAAALLSARGAVRYGRLIMTARVVLALAYIACLVGALQVSAPAFVMSYGLATCWLFVLPVRVVDAGRPVRSWLALLLVMQALHAFPVAGSQISWGTFLWVPLLTLGLTDIAILVPTAGVRRIAAWSAAVAIAVIGLNCGFDARARYKNSEDLGVTGAEHLRLPASFTTSIRLLVRNAQVHGDVLFSLPGMLSFHTWTGIESPTPAQATHWFNLLSPAQQDAIQRRLEASPRSVIIVQKYVYDLIDAQHFVTKTPLLRWILENYAPVFKTSSYEFWARKGRIIVPVNAARIYRGAPGAPFKYKFEVVLAPYTSTAVDSIELREFVGDTSAAVAQLGNGTARMLATPIDEAGSPTGGTAEARLPFDVRNVVRLEIFTNDVTGTFARNGGVLVFRDARGARVAEARVID